MHVALVAGVEDDGVTRGVEDPMDGDGQLDDAEVGAEVSAGSAHAPDQEGADLFRELLQLVAGETLEVIRTLDSAEQGHPTESTSQLQKQASCRLG